MKLLEATLYALRIPFNHPVKHSLAERNSSDSLILRVRDDEGHEGFGEGVARPYVTGETPEFAIAHIARTLWPAVAGKRLPPLEAGLEAVDALIPDRAAPGVIADNASRSALHLAILDLLLRAAKAPLTQILSPRRHEVVYSHVIHLGTTAQIVESAERSRRKGVRHVKAKVGSADDLARIKLLRENLGPSASIRVDANGAWTLQEAADIARQLEPFGIAAIEQPLPRGPVQELRQLKQMCPIPIMVDESLVTVDDAKDLIRARAVDYFNIRVSKCGGLGRSRAIADLARAAGIKLQIGSQIGETAILSMAGRFLAASLDDVAFVEGSASTDRLTEDVVDQDIRWGQGGAAPLPTGIGFGIKVITERLEKYAKKTLELK